MKLHILLLWLVGELMVLKVNSLSSLPSKPTLVVGATGKVGRLVVCQLLESGKPVHALVRNSKKIEVLPSNPHLTLFQGDLHDETALREAMAGCGSVIAVSGTTRLSRLSDFWPWRFFGNDPMKWCHDLSHPYFVNYLGIRRSVLIAEEAGVQKFVRLTGLTVGLPVFNPVTILFNLLLSLTGKWHSMAEQTLRASSLDYTILRPGGLSNETRANFPSGEVAVQLEVVDGDGGDPGVVKKGDQVIRPPARIGRADVAALCVECAGISSRKALRRTLACRWAGEHLTPVSQGKAAQGSASWEEELAKLDDPMPRASQLGSKVPCRTASRGQKSRPYAVAVAVAVPLVAALLLSAAALLQFAVGCLLGAARNTVV